jgi:hypothetical protein
VNKEITENKWTHQASKNILGKLESCFAVMNNELYLLSEGSGISIKSVVR